MKKNQWLIEQAKTIEKQKRDLKNATKNNVPEIYACFAKVLIDEYKNTPEEVVTLFARTQEVWTELVQNDSVHTMVEWCEKVTGVKLANTEEEHEGSGEN